jgi:hypothetical protein
MMKYLPEKGNTQGKYMKRKYIRKYKPTGQETFIDIPMLGEHLKPVIEESLSECGKDKSRKGTLLTPLLTVLVVIGLVLRRDLSYLSTLNWLVSGLRWLHCHLPQKLVAEGAISHARERLGVRVFQLIFQKILSRTMTLPKDFHGLTSVAFDGSNITMPDTKDNQEVFGKPKGGRGEGAFPQRRVVALLILPLRVVADFAFGAYKGKGTGERSLMTDIINRIPYKNLFFLWDAGLYSFELWQLALDRGNHVLAKLSFTVKPKPIPGKRFADGSYLAVISKKVVDPERSTEKKKFYTTRELIVRVIDYQIPGFRPARLITTILDPEITAMELAIHYHKRWDIEIAFDEIKTHQCATLRGQTPTILRSKKAGLVKQELYAIFIVYNLIRDVMYQSADQSNTLPRSISFLDTMQCMIDAIPHMCIVIGTQAKKKFDYLLSLITECTIDRPQRHRINPRVVKVKMSKFKRKCRYHKSSSRNLEKELQVIGLAVA